MRLVNEIQRAVKHLNASASPNDKIDDTQIEAYEQRIMFFVKSVIIVAGDSLQKIKR